MTSVKNNKHCPRDSDQDNQTALCQELVGTTLEEYEAGGCASKKPGDEGDELEPLL